MIHRPLIRSLFCAALVALVGQGCGSPARSSELVEPAGEIPLPPASGTPIGILIDESVSLGLRTEQLDQLREIDRDLIARNDELELQLRALDGPPPVKARRGPPGMNLKKPKQKVDEIGGKHTRGAQGLGNRSEMMQEREQNVLDAIAQALATLDPPQRASAEKLLHERGAYKTAEKVRDVRTAPPRRPGEKR